LDWMIGATMPLFHFLGLTAKRDAEKLVPEADAEDRLVGLDEVLDRRHGIFTGRGRITGAVGEEHAIRIERQDVVGSRRGWYNGHLRAEAGEKPQDVALHAIVDRDDVIGRLADLAMSLIPDPRCLSPLHGLAGGNVLGKVEAFQPAP